MPRADLVLLGEAPAFFAVEIIKGALLFSDVPVRQAEEEMCVLRRDDDLILRMAGYRNRMTQFYHEITDQELFQICSHQLDDVEQVPDALLVWLRANPERLEGMLR